MSKTEDIRGKGPEPPQPEERETDQDLARREKLHRLAEAGISLFPYKAARTHSVHEVVGTFSSLPKEELEEKKPAVEVPGRILSIRKMGRATFFHISDGRARLQVYIREDVAGAEAYELFALLDIGDVLAVRGNLFKTRTGELTVLCGSFTFLAKALHPLPEKWHGLQDVELRYRRRYLDLIMNPEVGEVFRLRSAIVAHCRRFFDARGYVEVETPMMHAIPGGALARPFKTFHNALGMDLYLRIAPELYLKRLVVGGLDKVYEINRSFRNEGIDAQHNPEFTMLEFYEAYKDYYDMIDLTEELLTGMVRDLFGREEVPEVYRLPPLSISDGARGKLSAVLSRLDLVRRPWVRSRKGLLNSLPARRGTGIRPGIMRCLGNSRRNSTREKSGRRRLKAACGGSTPGSSRASCSGSGWDTCGIIPSTVTSVSMTRIPIRSRGSS
jgi:lysyl-tRNA synthetase